ncbi:hypothetical protein G6F56_004734 [Rhizopus delemar]|nr:hypothetical protein G6F56_004734 [Rhizopus delemar]
MISLQNKLKNCSISVDASNTKSSETKRQATLISQKRSTTNWKTLPKLSLRTNSKRTFNKVYLPELKKFQVDAAQTVSAIGKGADRLRTAGRGAAEIFLDFQFIIKEGGSEEDMEAILEKPKRMAVYSFATGKELDQDAKELSTRALRLLESLRYLEDDKEDDKDLLFSSDVAEKKYRGQDSMKSCLKEPSNNMEDSKSREETTTRALIEEEEDIPMAEAIFF